jgi:16S rRNA (adenine1518-N6/adenine1519-N6)-dimethyltransferase
MGIEETSQLLRTYHIVPNKLLGQNFTVDNWIFTKLAEYSNLDKDDVVLDVGAGLGFLTSFLSGSCRKVIAVERDPIIAKALCERLRDEVNAVVIWGDVLKTDLPSYNKIVAIPPYYLSSHLVTWLLNQEIDCAVLMLQREFAERLVAEVGSEAYSWLTVVTSRYWKIELFDSVPKEAFYPQPEVESVIVRLTPRVPDFKVEDDLLFLQMVKWLFTQRNKKVSNAIAPFIRIRRKVSKDEAERAACSFPFGGRRVRTLSPRDFGELADAIGR